jgi:hypothetical protein
MLGLLLCWNSKNYKIKQKLKMRKIQLFELQPTPFTLYRCPCC